MSLSKRVKFDLSNFSVEEKALLENLLDLSRVDDKARFYFALLRDSFVYKQLVNAKIVEYEMKIEELERRVSELEGRIFEHVSFEEDVGG